MQHYLFDFDGTLVDSMPVYASVMLRILQENNVPYPENIIKIITPLGIPGTAQYFIEMGLDKPKDEIVATMIAYMVDAYTHRVPPKATVVEALREMKRRGDGLHVLTASPHDTLDPCLKRIGIFDLFDNVWSCNDFGTTKADPEIYRMAAERIGAPIGEIIFLDDNLGADQTAKAAGMQVFGVFDESSAEYEQELRAATDRYIYRFAELL